MWKEGREAKTEGEKREIRKEGGINAVGDSSAPSANIRYHTQVREMFFDSEKLSLSSKICLNKFSVF